MARGAREREGEERRAVWSHGRIQPVLFRGRVAGVVRRVGGRCRPRGVPPRRGLVSVARHDVGDVDVDRVRRRGNVELPVGEHPEKPEDPVRPAVGHQPNPHAKDFVGRVVPCLAGRGADYRDRPVAHAGRLPVPAHRPAENRIDDFAHPPLELADVLRVGRRDCGLPQGHGVTPSIRCCCTCTASRPRSGRRPGGRCTRPASSCPRSRSTGPSALLSPPPRS